MAKNDLSGGPRRGQRGYVPKKERVALAPGVWVDGFGGPHQLATVEPMVAVCGMSFNGILPVYGRAEPDGSPCPLCTEPEPEPVVHGPPPGAIDRRPDKDEARKLAALILSGEPLATVLYHCQMTADRNLVPVGYTPFARGFPPDNLACPACGLCPTREGWRYDFALVSTVSAPLLEPV